MREESLAALGVLLLALAPGLQEKAEPGPLGCIDGGIWWDSGSADSSARLQRVGGTPQLKLQSLSGQFVGEQTALIDGTDGSGRHIVRVCVRISRGADFLCVQVGLCISPLRRTWREYLFGSSVAPFCPVKGFVDCSRLQIDW